MNRGYQMDAPENSAAERKPRQIKTFVSKQP